MVSVEGLYPYHIQDVQRSLLIPSFLYFYATHFSKLKCSKLQKSADFALN